MTDIVNISPGHVGEPRENARTFQSVSHSDGWVVPNTETVLADVRSELSAGPYDAFDASYSSSSYDVTIQTGEAAVQGVLLARDTTTTVTLASNTYEQTVYVGWTALSKDTIVIGTASEFNDDIPHIPIWEFDTDGSGVVNARDEREIDSFVDVENRRYETSDGSGAKVDKAEVADSLSGATDSDFIRSDVNDRMAGVLGFEAASGLTGSLGNSDGEAWRAGGGTSDATFNLQGGHGRVFWAWNAYYDSGSSVWRSIAGGEPHAAVGMLSTDPGPGTNNANIVFATAPANTDPGDSVSWSYASVENDGDLNMGGHDVKNFNVDPVSSRPSNPDPGRMIFRTDKD